MTDNHSAPPDVTGLSERSVHAERPQVASVRGLPRGYTHTSIMETADGESPKAPACCHHDSRASSFLTRLFPVRKREYHVIFPQNSQHYILHSEVQTVWFVFSDWDSKLKILSTHKYKVDLSNILDLFFTVLIYWKKSGIFLPVFVCFCSFKPDSIMSSACSFL